MCPMVKKPLNECYCFELNSRNIVSAIHYCANNFQKCEIYKRLSSCRRTAHTAGHEDNDNLQNQSYTKHTS